MVSGQQRILEETFDLGLSERACYGNAGGEALGSFPVDERSAPGQPGEDLEKVGQFRIAAVNLRHLSCLSTKRTSM